ncbi:MAG: hypothetical protein ACRC92_16150 [Peptostreptococcaceae bacterium]
MYKRINILIWLIIFILMVLIVSITLFKESKVTDVLWGSACIAGIIYFIIIETKKAFNNIVLKLKIKDVKESVVSMKIVNKYFVEGKLQSLGGSKIPSKIPDTYCLELKYQDKIYKINDKCIYEKYKKDEFINIKLIENVDKYGKVISYKLENTYK